MPELYDDLEKFPLNIKHFFMRVQNRSGEESISHGDKVALYDYEKVGDEDRHRRVRLGVYDSLTDTFRSEFCLTYDVAERKFGVHMNFSEVDMFEDDSMTFEVDEEIYDEITEELNDII